MRTQQKNKTTKIIVFVSLVAFLSFAFKGVEDRYFEIAKNLDIFATLYKEVNRYYVDEVNPNKLIKSGIDGMLASLDPYTNYIPEDEIEDYRTVTTGQYGGIGAVIGKRGDKTIILMPYEGFPAQLAGMRIGDQIISIDGTIINDKNTGEVSKMLKGQAGTKVKVVLKRYGKKEEIPLEITRQKIKVDNVPFHGMVDNEIGYFHLTDFTAGASKEIRDAIEDLKSKGAKKLIFDLRDNPGGLLHEAIAIANIFVEKDNPIVITKGKVAEWSKTYNALDKALDTEIPIVILVNGRSASASEIVSGVVQDYDRGVIIGQKTFGKGLVQATRPLSYNSQLKVTTAKYYIPSGRCIQAIDYSHKNKDGAAESIPDSLKVPFKTKKNGRVFYDGGGVAADITVEKPLMAQITLSLIEKNLLFDFATEFALKNTTITSAKEFSLKDSEYQDFTKWLVGKEYDYKTKVETDIETLISTSKKEKYYDDIKEQIQNLSTKVSHNKESDLIKFKTEIKEMLEHEIVSRYYLRKGIIEASFDYDPDVIEAIKVLNDTDRYAKILKPEPSKDKK